MKIFFYKGFDRGKQKIEDRPRGNKHQTSKNRKRTFWCSKLWNCSV